MDKSQGVRLTMPAWKLSMVLSLIAAFGFSPGLYAQKAKAPTLDDVLGRVESNLQRYDTRLPSLFCDEHIVSSQMEQGQSDENTVVDSVFRVKRSSVSGRVTALEESREIEKVDGKPATSQNLDGPTLLSGAFEGGLAVVSLDQKACMRYELERPKRSRPNGPYVVRFATVLTPQSSSDCLLQEKSKGRVSIDPVSMQITHMEINTPHHTIIHGSAYTSPVVGPREVTVDYGPVLLGGETFWLPSAIDMRAVRGPGTFHMSVWSFRATYRNYHKLEVTSRIVAAPGK
jgi:hypothetical protein